MLTPEQIAYIDLLRRDYSQLDKEALLKLFSDAQWSEAESTEGIARFSGAYISDPASQVTTSKSVTNFPAWLTPPKASRYNPNIIFEDLVVDEPVQKVPVNNFNFFADASPRNILMGISIVIISIAIVFILYRFS